MDAPVPADKITEHEEAAHEQRNWVRLTFDCNDRCVFCLDAHTHDGSVRARDEIKAQILDGRRKGAQRLILSGGEPTIHPDFVDFVKLGRLAGYRKIQTVTNGRMFAYPQFLKRSLDAGLSEITFSIHGPNARIHDALVGTRGAFEEEVEGLRLALADGRPVINIDVCVNRGNVKHLAELLATFTAMGVREYDLLHVIPFGRAYTEGKETLFYDLEEARPHLLAAFEYSKKPGIHIWLNRFPPQHLEGYEHLIQDPYKLGDEVRGRKEEFAHLLERGVALDCRAPHRCGHCYLEPLCDTLEEVRATVETADFAVLRVDTTWDARQPAVYGGDPASKKRADTQMALRAQAGLMSGAEAEAAAGMAREPRLRLPVLGDMSGERGLPEFRPPKVRPLPALAAEARARRLWLVAPDVDAAIAAAGGFPGVPEVELELDDAAGLAGRLAEWTGPTGQVTIAGKRLARVVTRDAATAAALLAGPGDFEVALALSRATAPWLQALTEAPARLVLWQPTHERLTSSASDDVDLPAFFADFTLAVPVEGVPACVLGRPPRARPKLLDAAMLTSEGRVEIFRYARRYVLDRFRTKSLRCKACVHAADCAGLHINYVRARGYAAMRPITRA
ncbi:MAG: radical SAM protein [Myxococcales bacterium]|nr:radical SAM protein [Myxococcales bacterium]